MHVLITYKNEEDQIKNERARVAITFHTLYVYRHYSRSSRAAYTTVLSKSWAKFDMAQAFLAVLITRSNKK